MSSYPQAYIDYLVYFHAERDYFECHEVMEEYWKAHPDDPLSRTYVGLIQIAVGLYHQRRGNTTGAVKMLRSSMLQLQDDQLTQLGVDAAELRRRIALRLEALRQAAVAYADLDIPLQDEALLERCKQECLERGLGWGHTRDHADHLLIHKHTLRDRSEVIEARRQQLLIRQRGRERGPS